MSHNLPAARQGMIITCKARVSIQSQEALEKWRRQLISSKNRLFRVEAALSSKLRSHGRVLPSIGWSPRYDHHMQGKIVDLDSTSS